MAWFRERYKAGDLAWLKDRLPAGGYEKLGERIDAGDLGWLRERIATLPGMNMPGLDLGSFGLANAGGVATGAMKGAAAAAGAGSAAAMAAGRKRGLWLIPVAILAVIIATLGLSKCGNDDSADTEIAVESEAEATEAEATEAEATEAMASEAIATEASDAAATEAPATEAAAASGDIVATATAAGNFSTLTAAIGAAGLTETLQGAGPFTVFAPTDEAFAKLPPGVVDALLKPENKPVLAQILTYHVLAAKVRAADVKTGPVASVEGTDLDLVAADGKVMVNGANVTTADVAASNGLIHVIDAVLLPKSVDVAALLGGPAPTETTVAAAPVENAAGDAVPEGLTIYFANGSFRIDSEGQAKIEKAIARLSALAQGSTVNVVGHASATGDPAKNQVLSERRAKEVIDAIKRQMGDKAANVTFNASAKGDTDTIENEDKSRRVTIEVQK